MPVKLLSRGVAHHIQPFERRRAGRSYAGFWLYTSIVQHLPAITVRRKAPDLSAVRNGTRARGSYPTRDRQGYPHHGRWSMRKTKLRKSLYP
jgi:hypothetical protein